MPRQKTEVIFISADFLPLPRFPKGVQDYVKHYFEHIIFHGYSFFTASWVASYDHVKNKNVKGVAPKFPENYSHFREGLPEGQTVHSWILAKLDDKAQKEIVYVSHTWEDDSSQENND